MPLVKVMVLKPFCLGWGTKISEFCSRVECHFPGKLISCLKNLVHTGFPLNWHLKNMV